MPTEKVITVTVLPDGYVTMHMVGAVYSEITDSIAFAQTNGYTVRITNLDTEQDIPV